MPGPHDFAVRSDLNQRFGQPCAASQNFGQGVEASFVYAPVDRSQVRPALRLHLRANAAASTASDPAFVTTAKRPSCRERTGRAGRTDLPDRESGIFFAKGLDDPNQPGIVTIIRRSRNHRWLRLLVGLTEIQRWRQLDHEHDHDRLPRRLGGCCQQHPMTPSEYRVVMTSRCQCPAGNMLGKSYRM